MVAMANARDPCLWANHDNRPGLDDIAGPADLDGVS